MPAATSHRRFLCASSVVAFGGVFAAFVFLEVPGLGIGHFFYLPIALAALAYGTRGGTIAGAAAAGLYALGIVVSPHIPASHAMTIGMGLRFVALTSLGILIGSFVSSNNRLVERLRVHAERDFLTGMLNARVFDEALARRCANGMPFVLVLADMDNLKVINDAHGHAEGNRVIRMVADLFTAAAAEGDELARVGGDEFALLTQAQVEDAKEICMRLEQGMRHQGLELSFGWAASAADGTEPSELFRKADDRLYAAKLLGRNRRTVLAPTAAATGS